MSRESLVFVLGFLTVLTPFLGIPRTIKEIVFVVLGSLLMLLGFSLRRAAYLRSILREHGEHRGEEFAESNVSSEPSVHASRSAESV